MLDIPTRIILSATRPVAIGSPDHLRPGGTMHDNSRNPRFNAKLYALFACRQDLRILDLGCAGGGFVRDCIEDGYLAVGVEGSDLSKRLRRAEWRTIPEYLFTCDITAPFTLAGVFGDTPKPLQFDVVTAWEVLEHVAADDLPAVAANVQASLLPGGIWIASVSTRRDREGQHQTVRPKSWWIERLGSLGFEHHDNYVRYFNTQFVRGPKYGAPGSFHLVLSRRGDPCPGIPRERLVFRLYDRWLNCWLQRLLRLLVMGTPT
jgi:SAM-dependent methyltransferase